MLREARDETHLSRVVRMELDHMEGRVGMGTAGGLQHTLANETECESIRT